MRLKLNRRHALGAFAAAIVTAFAFSPVPASAGEIDKIHFIIPGGAGGGWDGTARGTGEALTKSGLVGSASYENMSGGGGGKAIGFLIENADSNHGTLLVNSTPIIIRSLTGRFPHSFRDLTPIAGTIGDYAALVVKSDSSLQTFGDLVAVYKNNPADVAVAGGSVPGGMDHLGTRFSTRWRVRNSARPSKGDPANRSMLVSKSNSRVMVQCTGHQFVLL